MAAWILYGRIVDAQFPDANEHDVIVAFHWAHEQKPETAPKDKRLVEAARTAIAQYSTIGAP
jgi:hypothetical protein